MNTLPDAHDRPGRLHRGLPAAGLILILLLGGFLRFEGLGLRSLWRDELCTWHVSRMNLGESLRWGPELTKPPLYQLLLRALTPDPHPSEWTLRFPAAVCGVLSILAAFWLGTMTGGWRVGLALCGLLACNPLQIEYSQEGRPYSMLVLGCIVSTAFWYRMVAARRRFDLFGYVVATVLTLYANYLAIFTVFGQFLWWLMVRTARSARGRVDRESQARTQAAGSHAANELLEPTEVASATKSASQKVWHGFATRAYHRLKTGATRAYGVGSESTSRSRNRQAYRPLAALGVTGLLCLPLAVRYLAFRSSMFQGLEWIHPPTWRSTFDVLERLTFGWQWVLGLLVPAVVFRGLAAFRPNRVEIRGRWTVAYRGPADVGGLLVVWFACAWFGLLVVSWLAHPAMVPRYTLPASVPAILLPLVVADRFDRRAPLVIALVFLFAAVPSDLGREVDPGLREMAAYLQETVDPEREVVVLTLDNTVYPGWEDSERLGFQYYPMPGIPLVELRVDTDGVTAKNPALKDPRGLYLVVLWADPFPILEAAGRQAVPIQYERSSYAQLLFTPYRLVHVAPLEQGS